MITLIPNFLKEEDLDRFLSSLDRSTAEPVEYSPNVNTIKHNRSPFKQLSDFGNVTFSETLIYTNDSFSPPHVDFGPMDEWKVWNKTAILFCSDTYSGGDFYFPKLNIMMKPNKNTLMLFPAGVGTDLYEHGVLPVKSGERITTIFRFVKSNV
jgi:hypothetical protein